MFCLSESKTCVDGEQQSVYCSKVGQKIRCQLCLLSTHDTRVLYFTKPPSIPLLTSCHSCKVSQQEASTALTNSWLVMCDYHWFIAGLWRGVPAFLYLATYTYVQGWESWCSNAKKYQKTFSCTNEVFARIQCMCTAEVQGNSGSFLWK